MPVRLASRYATHAAATSCAPLPRSLRGFSFAEILRRYGRHHKTAQSHNREATIDGERRSGNERSFVAGKPENRPGDLLRPRPAAEQRRGLPSALVSTSSAMPPSAQMSSPVAAPIPAPPPVISAALPSTRFMLAQSLGRNDAELLGGGSDARALLFDRGLEFSRAAEVGKLSGVVEPRRNRGIGADRGDVRRDARAQRERHFGRTEKPDQPVEREVRIAGLRDRRHVW